MMIGVWCKRMLARSLEMTLKSSAKDGFDMGTMG
jgi:hypothetical protein